MPALALLLLAICAPSAAAVNVSSSFDETNESWRTGTVSVTGTAGSGFTFAHSSTFSSATRAATDGNPGGMLTYTEASAPAPPEYKLVQFVTPATWAADWSSNYGGLLSFDYWTTLEEPANDTLLVEIIVGSTRLMARPQPWPQPRAWISYAVPLHESVWEQCDTSNVCTAISKEAFQAVLASTDASKTIRIYATYMSVDGEQGNLDNPALAEDNTAPETEIRSDPGPVTSDPTPTFTFNATGEPSSSYGDGNGYVGFDCSLDQGAADYEACGGTRPFGDDGTHTPSLPLADGGYTFRVTGTDPAGNEDPTPATHAFTVDTTDPDPAITKRPKARIRTRKRKVLVRYEFTATDATALSFRCKLDAKPPSDCTSPKAYRVGRGKHTFVLTATDAAGNSATESDSFKVVRKR